MDQAIRYAGILDGMVDRVMLLDEQRALLIRLVDADRKQPRGDRPRFLMVSTFGGDSVIHPGMQDGDEPVNGQDIETLIQAGLLSGRYSETHTLVFFILPLGFAYYEHLKSSGQGPVQQVEAEMHQLIDAEGFQTRHPEAHKKWVAAQALLWRSGDADLSTIGHLCREAMQEFAGTLVDRFKPVGASPNKSHDVSRIKAVVTQREQQLGSARTAFMQALIEYWGALSDMVQRQEHAGAKEGEAVTWADAQSVVLHTLVVFSEFDRSLS